MSFKKLLWNDNASELLGRPRDRSDDVVSEPPGKDTVSHRPYTARKLLKGSAAFTTALLFGTEESQGLVRTLREASAEAGKNVLKGTGEGSSPMQTSESEGYYSYMEDGYHLGPEGPGYYVGGIKLDDD